MLDIDSIKNDYQALLAELADPEVVSDSEKFRALTEKKSILETILSKKAAIEEMAKQIAESEAILAGNEEQDLVSLAHEEIISLKDKKTALEKSLDDLLVELQSKKKNGVNRTEAIIEIRAGVGGEESALFVRDLYGMYVGFARNQGWQLELLDSSATELGGFKEIIFELKPSKSRDGDVFGKMSYEAGVHRVQRIPKTEKSGRVHTSTVTVAVLLKPRIAKSLQFAPSDLQIEFFNASGPGGQNVNKRKTAVRVIHLPSGLVITSRTERSQLQNKENALAILAARLLQTQQEKEEVAVSGTRRSQIGGAKRAEKIRTYNFPQDRLTDHRVKKSWHHLEEILAGKLDSVVEELQSKGNNESGQGIIEALLLILGLFFILAVALPKISPKMKSLDMGRFLGTGVISTSLSNSNSPSISPEASASNLPVINENEKSPSCGEILTIPSATGKAPFKVLFVATGRPKNSPIKGFYWDFTGDNQWDTSLTTQPQSFVFETPGDYKVRLLIVDTLNNSRLCETLVKVTAPGL